jgi:hypothetical protein
MAGAPIHTVQYSIEGARDVLVVAAVNVTFNSLYADAVLFQMLCRSYGYLSSHALQIAEHQFDDLVRQTFGQIAEGFESSSYGLEEAILISLPCGEGVEHPHSIHWHTHGPEEVDIESEVLEHPNWSESVHDEADFSLYVHEMSGHLELIIEPSSKIFVLFDDGIPKELILF